MQRLNKFQVAVYHGAPRNRLILILITIYKMEKWKLKYMNCSK